MRQFTRPMRGRPDHLILDEFDCEFFLIFNFEEDPETPASHDTCDIQIVPLEAEDFLAESIRLVANAKQHDVMRLLAALGVQRFSDKVKTAYYGTVGSPLRGASHDI